LSVRGLRSRSICRRLGAGLRRLSVRDWPRYAPRTLRSNEFQWAGKALLGAPARRYATPSSTVAFADLVRESRPRETPMTRDALFAGAELFVSPTTARPNFGHFNVRIAPTTPAERGSSPGPMRHASPAGLTAGGASLRAHAVIKRRQPADAAREHNRTGVRCSALMRPTCAKEASASRAEISGGRVAPLRRL